MSKNIFLRICATIILSIFGTMASYYFLLGNLRKYFFEFSKNEEMFLNSKSNYDVILLGSSRMFNTLNPKVIDSITGYSSFNLGQNGASMAELTTNLKAYLVKHKPPKIVCVAVDMHMLSSTKNINFFPYYLTTVSNPEIKTSLQDDGIKIFLYQIMPFLKITEFGDFFKGSILKNALHKREVNAQDLYYKGYISNGLDTVVPQNFPTVNVIKKTNLPITQKGKDALTTLLNVCKAKNIKLICFYSPEYRQGTIATTENKDVIFRYYDSVFAMSRVPFIRYDTIQLSRQHRMFANVSHLNREGAEAFSKIFAQDLVKMYPVGTN